MPAEASGGRGTALLNTKDTRDTKEKAHKILYLSFLVYFVPFVFGFLNGYGKYQTLKANCTGKKG